MVSRTPNVAVTPRSEVIVTAQTAPFTASHPLHPCKVELLSGVAERVTDIPYLRALLHKEGQAPPRHETMPFPAPARLIVSCAVGVLFSRIDTFERPGFTTARSVLPSSLKSPLVAPWEYAPA